MSTRALRLVAMVVLTGLFVACGSNEAGIRRTPTPLPDEETPTPTEPSGTPSPPPDQLRVAYINLMSPIAVDANDQLAAETFEERLQIVIDELKEFQPDIVALSEATWTEERGSAARMLARGLSMEGGPFARSVPGFPGQSQEESAELAREIGFEEGDTVLSRYPILSWQVEPLNPRVSESEGRTALHVVVKGPEPIGEVDVYVARLAGDEPTREAQAADYSAFVENTRSGDATLVLGDLGSAPDSVVVEEFSGSGLWDVTSAYEDEDTQLATCCRDSIVVDESTVEGEEEAEPDAPSVRTSYVFCDAWQPASVETFGAEPGERSDGTQLYASDHNGILVTFDLAEGSLPRQ